MAFWRLYYHLVWATKYRQPLILEEYENKLYNYIIGKSDSEKCIVHAINGMRDHLHLIVSIPPTLAIYDYVKKIKGSSSHFVNHDLSSSPTFAWQSGYGIFSVGVKNLSTAISYVNNQKEHHANNTIINALEQIKSENDPPNQYSHLPKSN